MKKLLMGIFLIVPTLNLPLFLLKKMIFGKVTQLTNFKGKIIWDKTKPDGQPRRRLDVNRAKKEFGFVAKTPFEEGLKREREWYEQNILEKK